MDSLKFDSSTVIEDLKVKLDQFLGSSFIGRFIKPFLLQFLEFLLKEVISLVEAQLQEVKDSVEKISEEQK